MIYSYLPQIFLLLICVTYIYGSKRARQMAADNNGFRYLHSLPAYHGVYYAIVCCIPALLLYILWQVFETSILTAITIHSLPPEIHALSDARFSLFLNDVRNTVSGVFSPPSNNTLIQRTADHYMALQTLSHTILTICLLLLVGGTLVPAARKITPAFRARNIVESIIVGLLIACAVLAVLTTIGIIFSILFEALRFFHVVNITDFLFGLKWSPQIAIRADQYGSSGAFGLLPVLAGTLLISGIAMCVAIPIGLMSAIYLSEYARPGVRTLAKPLLEILAGIPTVVYGFFAALVIAPLMRDAGVTLGLSISSESAMAAGLVMGFMIIPFVSSLSDDVIHAVPQALRDGSYALGATNFETIKNVIIPAALPGIVGSIMLAVSRAMGETMIVVMAAGLSANLTWNPFKAVTTVTVQIISLLIGDQEFDSPKTLAAFALGLFLFLFTLTLNFIALRVVHKYHEHYE